jgi:hypothetical protein
MQNKIQEHRDKHKAHKKECNVVIKIAKTNYIQQGVISSNNTPKVLWK